MLNMLNILNDRVSLLAILLPAMLLTCCSKAKVAAEAEPPVSVQVDDVTRGPIDVMVEADAVLYPVNQASVTSKISAPIRRILVNRGDHVKAGQLLAELESRDLASATQESKSQFEQTQSALQTVTGATVPEDRTKAEADVQSAQQALDAAKRVYDSRVELEKQGALARKLVDDAKVAMVQAQSQFDTARRHLQGLTEVSAAQQVKGAQDQVNAAKAHYDSASIQLSYAQVFSPINGIVADRPLFPGEMAAAGAPIISIVDISKVVARANLPIDKASLVKAGNTATINGPDGILTGTVTVISPAVDPNTTTLQVWVQADNPSEKLKPGASVHVAIRAGLIQDTLLVPAAALLNSDEGGEKVMVVDKTSKARERKVTVGVREGSRVQILGGVVEGEKVVTTGGLGLEDKAKVEVKSEEDSDDDDEADDNADKGAAAAPSPANKTADGKGKK